MTKGEITQNFFNNYTFIYRDFPFVCMILLQSRLLQICCSMLERIKWLLSIGGTSRVKVRITVKEFSICYRCLTRCVNVFHSLGSVMIEPLLVWEVACLIPGRTILKTFKNGSNDFSLLARLSVVLAVQLTRWC